jgi:hypothetical protein
MTLTDKLRALRDKGTMGLDHLFDEAAESIKQSELSKQWGSGKSAVHWHGRAAGIIYAIEALQSLKVALSDLSCEDDSGAEDEAA